MSNEYVTVSLPKPLVDSLEEYITNHPELGIRSRTEAVVIALRRMLFPGQ